MILPLPRGMNRLVLRMVAPAVLIIALVGVGLYAFVLRTVADFADDRIAETLSDVAKEVYDICDANFTALMQSGRMTDPRDVTVKQAFTVGAGVQWFRCFSADNDETSPREVWRNGVAQGAAPNYYLEESGVDEFGLPTYDSLWYTFAGTKIMARFMFDPKPLLGLTIFGEEDLKLYAEAAILGVSNYPNNTISTPTVFRNEP